MCSRYSLTSPPEAVRAYFGYGDTPEFPGPLQYRADPTHRRGGCRDREGGAALQANALGLVAVLRQGPEEISDAHQRPLRGGARQALVPQRHALAPLPHSRRRFL